MAQPHEKHIEEETESEVVSELPAIIPSSSEIDVQIATAHRFPRSLKKFKDDALAMAVIDQETAESCFYVLPRGGKSIEGPSVRLAEICGSAWGNMRYGARITNEDGKYIYAEGMAHDLEKNVAMKIEVRRRITDRYNKRYNDDMVTTTANAACAIALRNAIFKVVPRAFVDPIYRAAKKTAVGDAQTLEQRRNKMLDHFAKMTVTKERIFAAMEIKGIEDVDLTVLEKLIGIATAIKEGDTTIDEALPPLASASEQPQAQPKSKTEALAQKLSKKAEPAPEAAQPAREPGEEG